MDAKTQKGRNLILLLWPIGFTNTCVGVWERKSKRMLEFSEIFDFQIDFLMAPAFEMMIYSTKSDEASQQLSNNY